jgi:hypothetical protein
MNIVPTPVIVPGLLDDVMMGLRLVRDLPGYLRRPLTVAEARSILHRRLEHRERDFLALARDAIFANPASPYRALLRLAGCELGDLERHVARDGIEATLGALYRAGVYLTVDEFKGRQPIVRGATTIVGGPERARNPLARAHLWSATSGSRGARTPVPMGLASLRDRAVNMYLALDARGGAGWRTGVWGMPGVGPLRWYSICGGPAARWFSPVDPTLPGLHPRYRWSVRALTWTSRTVGVPLPRQQHVPLSAPLPIARWMADELRAGGVPHLWAFPSSAVRVCRTARDQGLDLAGARFTVTGEPVTGAGLDVVRGVGADAVADYGSADAGGSVSYGCLAPEAADDVHVFGDLNALIEAGPGPLPADALLVSSLRRTSRMILFNVSMGDRAVVSERRCGCPLEALGWRTHLRDIRSFEKLTAGGMTFLDVDVVRVLEEVLPRRFGGGPSDYQLVEDETTDGQPRLRLRVAPSVGPLDAGAVVEAFFDAVGTGTGTARLMMLQWRQAGMLTVERADPGPTPSGKILHLRRASPR